jgi:hypothetical protein
VPFDHFNDVSGPILSALLEHLTHLQPLSGSSSHPPVVIRRRPRDLELVAAAATDGARSESSASRSSSLRDDLIAFSDDDVTGDV